MKNLTAVILLCGAVSGAAFADAPTSHTSRGLLSIPVETFVSEWVAAGRSIGYPKHITTSSGVDMRVHQTLVDPAWADYSFERWKDMGSTTKFYMVGAILKSAASREIPAASFKIEVIAMYQCLNALYDFQTSLVSQGLNFAGQIKHNVTICAVGLRNW